MSKNSDARKQSLWGTPTRGLFGPIQLDLTEPILPLFAPGGSVATPTEKPTAGVPISKKAPQFGDLHLDKSLEEAWILEKKRRQAVATSPASSDSPNVVDNKQEKKVGAPSTYYRMPNTPNISLPGSTQVKADRWKAEQEEAGAKVMFSIARTAARRKEQKQQQQQMMEDAEATATDANLTAATTPAKGATTPAKGATTPVKGATMPGKEKKKKTTVVTYFFANDSVGTGDRSAPGKSSSQPYIRVEGAAAGKSLEDYAKRYAGEQEEKRRKSEVLIAAGEAAPGANKKGVA